MNRELYCGRILHLYSNRWIGPRPAIVVNCWPPTQESDEYRVNVNVQLDGSTDGNFLNDCRSSPSGNTINALTVHDEPPTGRTLADTTEYPKGTSEQRNGFFYCCWP